MKSVIAKRFIEISIEVYNQPLLGIILLAGNLLGASPALPAWRGYGKNSAGKGVTSPALPAWSLWEEFYLLLGPCRLCRLGGGGCGKNSTGKGMSSPALPAARALSLAAGPLQDK